MKVRARLEVRERTVPTEPKDQDEFSGTMAPKSSTLITYFLGF